jgi:hypothetical protein
MLRTLSVAAPAVAAVMVVVLIIEPPALLPGERIPTLRVLTARTGAGLDAEQMGAAIAWGQRGEPEPYVLNRVPSTRTPVDEGEAAGAVYTPFLRIAWVAHAREQSGRPLTIEEVPNWLAAPVVYVALRAPPVARADAPGPPWLAFVPADTATCCLDPQPTLVRPLWVTDDPAVLARFGAPVPFSDLGLVAAYPIDVLRGGFDFVAFYRVRGPDGPASIEMRGRLDASELERWR